jgi:hypothetical protein
MRIVMIALAGLVAAISTPANGQPAPHTHHFEGFPEVTVTGIVESVSEAGPVGCEACDACSDCAGSHLVLRTRTSHYEIHLAPAWFLELHGFVFTPGDTITVIGTRIRSPIWRGLTARKVTKDGIVMMFRDEHGLPLWRRTLTDD